MRLNLPNYHCVQFGLTSDFKVPLEKEADIVSLMTRTHAHEIDGEGPRMALFGSRTSTKGVIHRVRGRLTMTRNPTDLDVDLLVSSHRVDDVRPPPRPYRPVSLLVEASGDLFGSIEVNFNAVFEYDQRHGYRSSIIFPVPLMIPKQTEGITHIESAQFSRRDNDEIEYQIIVMDPEDSDSLIHSVTFKSTLGLSAKSVKGLIDRAHRISTQLLIKEDEA